MEAIGLGRIGMAARRESQELGVTGSGFVPNLSSEISSYTYRYWCVILSIDL